MIKKLPFLTPLIVSLTLGLAPLTPEPHLFGKIQWISGGAIGMGWIDFFDLLLHGAPWVWLLFSMFQWSLSLIKST